MPRRAAQPFTAANSSRAVAWSFSLSKNPNGDAADVAARTGGDEQLGLGALEEGILLATQSGSPR